MESKIGPTLQIIPEQRIYSCFGCKYHEFNNCLKMNINGEVLEDTSRLKRKNGILIPFILENNSETPPQCPYLKTEERNDKISDLGISDIK